MKRLLGIAIGILSPAIGYVGAKLYFDRKTRREAAEAKPRIEALLDEMISVAVTHKSSLGRIVGMNTLKTVNDEKRERYLTLHTGGSNYTLDVSTMLVGKKKDGVCVRIHRGRGDASLHVSWPGIVEYWPMEAWLQERLTCLDALVGTITRLGSIMRRFPDLDDDEGPPTTN